MADSSAAAAAAPASSAPDLSTLTVAVSSATLSDDGSATLSRRGEYGANTFQLPEGLKRLLANMYDPDTNPQGIINAGIADNSLCRDELLRYLLAPHRLQLSPADLTYADRFTTSTRLLEAIAKLFNEYTPDWPDTTRSPKPRTKVVPDHIAIASGATGILDELFWNLCDEGDGVLLSTPYYNAFDNDLTSRAKAQVVPVHLPLPGAARESLDKTAFASETVAAYEAAYERATKQGVKVRALLLCNPHNPTGTIYPRDTVIALATLAAKYKLHFVSDEIYARSCFATADVREPAVFHSILSIDVVEECGLDSAYVHVVTSASKDFAVNGFRLGVLVSQHNAALLRAMASVGLLSQSASPAASLWHTWLSDEAFLRWYLAENRRRLARAYEHTVQWARLAGIPYLPSNAGFFVMLDFSTKIGITKETGESEAAKREEDFVDRLLDCGVFVAPGTQYHHPNKGWFRFTFSMQPKTLKLALERTEQALRLEESVEKNRPLLDLDSGGTPAPDAGKRQSWIQKLVG
ncbi:hypothetical protein PaG_04424 [Moesziomyces aphidis]|uniref:Aminotransferase class I/classII large domain-containing protein n=1 Tax=Moesziomyces aphidis TaxID=84754 RepID=W3VKR5_MOEAP|nr:hypothetical protein PaG_04424 [Moesziomyces aphidis]